MRDGAGLTRKQILLRGLAGAATAGVGAAILPRGASAADGGALADLGAWETGAVPATGSFGTSLPPRIAASTGATRVVDAAAGNDGHPGTEAAPWKTLNKAFASLRPGETALVKTGTYSGRIDPTGANSGTSAAPKTLAAYPGHTPVFTSLIRANGLQYWRFKGIVFAPANLDTGFYAVGSTAHLDFESVTFRDCALGSGIVTETTCSDLQWWRCTFSNNGRPNTILDHGLYLKSSNCVVADCLFVRNSSYGLQMYPSARNNIVVNNTLVENGIRTSDPNWTGGIVLAGPTTGANKVLNNIIAFNTGYGARSDSGTQSGNVFRRNLVWGNTRGATLWQVSGRVAESETIAADPLFVNRAARDYRLAASSPAIDRSVTEWAPPTDFTGAPRR